MGPEDDCEFQGSKLTTKRIQMKKRFGKTLSPTWNPIGQIGRIIFIILRKDKLFISSYWFSPPTEGFTAHWRVQLMFANDKRKSVFHFRYRMA